MTYHIQVPATAGMFRINGYDLGNSGHRCMWHSWATTSTATERTWNTEPWTKTNKADTT